MTEQLRLMERVCDHMLEAFFVPQLTQTRTDDKGKQKVIDDMTLLDTIMKFAEEDFSEEFPNPAGVAEGGMDPEYYAAVQASFTRLEECARTAAVCDEKCSVLKFKASYDNKANAYEISDISLRPCVWETGLIRQLTDYAVRGLTQCVSKPSLRFRLKSGPAFVVSLTMEDDPSLFLDKSSTFDMYTKVFEMPHAYFGDWNEFYSGKENERTPIDAGFKTGWTVDRLRMDRNRFAFAKLKFRNMSSWWQRTLKYYIEQRRVTDKKKKAAKK